MTHEGLPRQEHHDAKVAFFAMMAPRVRPEMANTLSDIIRENKLNWEPAAERNRDIWVNKVLELLWW